MLILNARTVWTGVTGEPRLEGVSIRIFDGKVSAIGALVPQEGEEVLDASDCVVAPGWVNTHHHFFQSLLKAVPEGLHVPLSDWSKAVSAPFRGSFNAAIFRTAVQVALYELVASGCTTVADHQFLTYPSIDFDCAEIIFEEARRFGVRMVLCRGGATLAAQPDSALPPALRPERLADFIDHTALLAARFNDPGEFSFQRIVVAPTLVTSRVRLSDLVALARVARELGLRMHSHLNETGDDNRYCQDVYGFSAVDLCEETEWLGGDVWFAHMVHTSPDEVRRLARSGTSVAHCPVSNARLGSGIAPIMAMQGAGMTISLGVDGAGSNESADMLSEMHFAWLIHQSQQPRLASDGLTAPRVEDVVRWGSAGGADVLGLNTGRIVPGAAADIGVYGLNEPGHFGSHDPATALLLSSSRPALKLLMCGGKVLVKEGRVLGLDRDKLALAARHATQSLVDSSH